MRGNKFHWAVGTIYQSTRHNIPHHLQYKDQPFTVAAYSTTRNPQTRIVGKWPVCVIQSRKDGFLGAFTKLGKRLSASSWQSACPPQRLHKITQLPTNGLSWNFTLEYFYKICRESSGFIKSNKNDRQSMISRSVLLRMRNVSDKSCRENRNTYLTFNNFFPLWDNVEKYLGNIIQVC